MVVVEGADNSGKSTFARALGLEVFSAGPAPRTVEELAACLKDQWNRASTPCVQDRLTCISQQVYSDAPEAELLMQNLIELVSTPRVVIVYCRPPNRVLMDLSSHKVKSYDTEEHIQNIVSNQHRYVERYDELMSKVPHVVYDWTDHDPIESIQRLVLPTQDSDYHWKKFRELIAMAKVRF